jgi:hypothetical protein
VDRRTAAERPEALSFTPAERRLIARLRTPAQVQRFLNASPYNTEPGKPELKSFRQIVRRKSVHCLEAALFAAAVLEQHGYPPLLLSFESIDKLDHVLFVYRENGRWGAIGRSRDPGLHGRKPVYRTLRALAASYMAPFIDYTGEITGYALYDMRGLKRCNWRFSPRNVWALETELLNIPHRKLRWKPARVDRQRAWYRAWMAANPGRKPADYPGKETWSELPGKTR